MDVERKQEFIRQKAEENQSASEGEKVLWSRHGIAELVNEGWTRQAVEEGMQNCEVIEEYAASRRSLPDCLALGWLFSGEPFHAVIAIDVAKGRLLVITVYKPAPEELQNDWRTRSN